MALPYVVDVRCVAISKFPGSDVDGTSAYAIIEFEIDPDEASDDRIVGGGHEERNGRLRFLVTQAQKDDFTEGSDYQISMSAL